MMMQFPISSTTSTVTMVRMISSFVNFSPASSSTTAPTNSIIKHVVRCTFHIDLYCNGFFYSKILERAC